MARPKAKREIATKNIRIYPSTLSALQLQSIVTGKTIARLLYEAFGETITGAQANSGTPYRVSDIPSRTALRKKLLGTSSPSTKHKDG